jgi:hypothetical protein
VAKPEGLGEVSDDYVARTPDALEELTGLVHDEWFNVHDIEYMADRGEVKLELLRASVVRKRFGWESLAMSTERAGTLIVRKVRSMEVDDEAQVGDYEVDYLTGDEAGRVVQLHATIPLRIDFHVDEIDVSFLPAAPGQP